MKKLILPFLFAFVALAQLPHPAALSPSTSAQSVAVWNSQGNALAVAASGGVYFPGNNGTQGSIRTTLANGTSVTAIGTNAFTIWLRFRETSTEGSVAVTLYEPGGGLSWVILNMSSGRPYIEKGLAGVAQTNMVFDSLKGRLSGSMVDFVMVRSAGTITYYWNGVATTATTGADSAGTINLSSSAALWVGGGFNASQNFNSLVNRAAMFNRALSSDEVLSLGTYGVARTDQWGTTASPGCIMDLDLTKGSGTTVADRSGNLTPTTTGSFTHQLPRSVTSGTVTSVSVTPTNGVSATVATSTTTPALSFTLGDITPTTVYLRGTDAVSNILQMQYISETIPRFAVRKDGVLLFGSGSAVPDVDLYRSAANTLKTDTDFEASNIRAGTVTTTGLIAGGTGSLLTLYVTNGIAANSLTLYNGANSILLYSSTNRLVLIGSLDPYVDATYSLGQGGLRWLNGVFSGLVQANTLQSTVATGTAPLTVASTTLVSNLNADRLDGLHKGGIQPASAALTNLNRTIGFTVDGGGSAITTGKTKGYITAPLAGTIRAWSIAVNAGTATVKVWKVATGTAVPTIANVINTSGVSISSGTYIRSTTLTDFTTTTVAANDVFAFDVTAASTASEMTFQLEITQ